MIASGRSGCESPTEGCPCDAPGSVVECTVYRVSGDYVACSKGTMSCGDDRRYGECEGAAREWDPDAGN